ncbi:MAG: glycosyltransferase family 2 protein [Bacteroidales bacterium]
MLSILIPVYNRDVTTLVEDLQKQAVSLGVVFEILCIDDASTEYLEHNRSTQSLFGVRWIYLNENVGRSVIRNLLIDNTYYELLVFLDCDMEICKDDYLQIYLRNKECRVICGGCVYSKDDLKPGSALHYYNGIKRESFGEEGSNLSSSFLSGNFFIHKSVFDKVRFNDNIKGYGHEDTLFGIELKEAGFKVVNLNNPTLHRGVDSDEVYLKKTRCAIDNLFCEDQDIERKLHNEVRLTRFASDHKLLLLLSGLLFPICSKAIEFASKSLPSICNLIDFYKLSYLGYKFNKRRRYNG